MIITPNAPRARLFTVFGTVLYVDVASGCLRHGPYHGCHRDWTAVQWGQKALELDPNNQRLKNNLDFFIRRREELRAGG
jgi:hypothetical protein